MDEYKLIGKDEVKRMLGTSSDQTAYKVIRQLNRELEAQGIKTVQGKVDRGYFIKRYFSTQSEKGGE